MRIASILVVCMSNVSCGDGATPEQSKIVMVDAMPVDQLKQVEPDKPSLSEGGHQWVLHEFAAESVPKASPPHVTVIFHTDGRLSGTKDCNGISGQAHWLRNGSFSGLNAPMIATTMHCGRNVSGKNTADAFWRKMVSADTWSIKQHQLIIHFEDRSVARLNAHSSLH